MKSLSKSRIQGVWDPAHSTRTGIIAHSTRVVIPSDCCHFIWLPPLHPAATTFHLDVSHPESGCRRHSAAITLGCFASEILTPDGRGERFNFPGHTYPDPLIALTRRVSQPFCTVPRCLLKLPDMCDQHFEIF